MALILLHYTTGGIGHGKMYLGPKTRHGIIIYYRQNPSAFIAATAFNYAAGISLLFFSGAEIMDAVRRKGRGTVT